MRLVLIVACTLALGGCNYVFSEKPLFTAADARGAPQLRPGVWMKPSENCTFDKSQPVKAWPGCASGMLVRPDRLEDPEDGSKRILYLIAAGDPPVMQIPFNDDPKKPGYVYGGIEVTKRDGQGRVTEFISWIAQCGPPPPKPKPGEAHPRYVTEHPLPGLTVDKEGSICFATKPGPVRASARASKAWNEDRNPASWIRDGDE